MSTPEEIEEKIKEKRVLEASKKGLIGQNGKIAIILKVYGEPIVNQREGGGLIDSYYIDLENNESRKPLEDIYDSNELLRNIPVMNLDSNERPNTSEWSSGVPEGVFYSIDIMGFHFDGLRRGMHMEISYNQELSEMNVYYKGYLVYKETKGELLAYVPQKEWEGWIESLYKSAKERYRVIKEQEFERSIKASEKEKKFWWHKIKEKWGIE